MIDWLYHSNDRGYVIKLKVEVELQDAYDVEGTADMLVIGVATVWRWIRDGKILSFKLAGRTLISKSEVDRVRGLQKEKTATVPVTAPSNKGGEYE